MPRHHQHAHHPQIESLLTDRRYEDALRLTGRFFHLGHGTLTERVYVRMWEDDQEQQRQKERGVDDDCIPLLFRHVTKNEENDDDEALPETPLGSPKIGDGVTVSTNRYTPPDTPASDTSSGEGGRGGGGDGGQPQLAGGRKRLVFPTPSPPNNHRHPARNRREEDEDGSPSKRGEGGSDDRREEERLGSRNENNDDGCVTSLDEFLTLVSGDTLSASLPSTEYDLLWDVYERLCRRYDLPVKNVLYHTKFLQCGDEENESNDPVGGEMEYGIGSDVWASRQVDRILQTLARTASLRGDIEALRILLGVVGTLSFACRLDVLNLIPLKGDVTPLGFASLIPPVLNSGDVLSLEVWCTENARKVMRNTGQVDLALEFVKVGLDRLAGRTLRLENLRDELEQQGRAKDGAVTGETAGVEVLSPTSKAANEVPPTRQRQQHQTNPVPTLNGTPLAKVVTPAEAENSATEQILTEQLNAERSKVRHLESKVQDLRETVLALEEETCEVIRNSPCGSDASNGNRTGFFGPNDDDDVVEGIATSKEEEFARTVRALERALQLEMNKREEVQRKLDEFQGNNINNHNQGLPNGTPTSSSRHHHQKQSWNSPLLSSATPSSPCTSTRCHPPGTPSTTRKNQLSTALETLSSQSLHRDMTDLDELLHSFIHENAELDDDDDEDHPMEKSDVVWFAKELKWRFEGIMTGCQEMVDDVKGNLEQVIVHADDDDVRLEKGGLGEEETHHSPLETVNGFSSPESQPRQQAVDEEEEEAGKMRSRIAELEGLVPKMEAERTSRESVDVVSSSTAAESTSERGGGGPATTAASTEKLKSELDELKSRYDTLDKSHQELIRQRQSEVEEKARENKSPASDSRVESESLRREFDQQEERQKEVVDTMERSLAAKDKEIQSLQASMSQREADLATLQKTMDRCQSDAKAREEEYQLGRNGDGARIRYLEGIVRDMERDLSALTEGQRGRPYRPTFETAGLTSPSSSPTHVDDEMRMGYHDGDSDDGGGADDGAAAPDHLSNVEECEPLRHPDAPSGIVPSGDHHTSDDALRGDNDENVNRIGDVGDGDGQILALASALESSEQKRAEVLEELRAERESYATRLGELNDVLRRLVGNDGRPTGVVAGGMM